jgi:hypothetical protein
MGTTIANRRAGYIDDPRCPAVDAFCLSLNDRRASATNKIAPVREDAEGLEAFERHHQATCARCRSYRAEMAREDRRSAIWGGGTVGLTVGLIVGFFRGRFGETVLYAVGIGVALGFGVRARRKRACVSRR